jgi:hypothetical protein
MSSTRFAFVAMSSVSFLLDIFFSYESGILENPATHAPDLWQMTVSPKDAPDTPEVLTIEFAGGLVELFNLCEGTHCVIASSPRAKTPTSQTSSEIFTRFLAANCADIRRVPYLLVGGGTK